MEAGPSIQLGLKSADDYRRVLEEVLLPPRELRAGQWSLWFLVSPSFHPEFAVGFFGDDRGGQVQVRSARVRLWGFWLHALEGGAYFGPNEHLEAIRLGLLPPRVWTASVASGGWEWLELVEKARNSGPVWERARRADRIVQLDGCGWVVRLCDQGGEVRSSTSDALWLPEANALTAELMRSALRQLDDADAGAMVEAAAGYL
jgi:hypothetical protein